VAREQDRRVLRALAQVGQRYEVVGQAAIGPGDDRRAPAQHGVAGENRPLAAWLSGLARCPGGTARHHEAQAVGCVPGGPHDMHLHIAEVQGIPVRQALSAEAMQRIQRSHRDSGHLVQPMRALGVIRVPVGQENGGKSRVPLPGHGKHISQMALVVGTRIDDDRPAAGRADDPGIGPIERHRTGIGRQHACDAFAHIAARPGRRRAENRESAHVQSP